MTGLRCPAVEYRPALFSRYLLRYFALFFASVCVPLCVISVLARARFHCLASSVAREGRAWHTSRAFDPADRGAKVTGLRARRVLGPIQSTRVPCQAGASPKRIRRHTHRHLSFSGSSACARSANSHIARQSERRRRAAHIPHDFVEGHMNPFVRLQRWLGGVVSPNRRSHTPPWLFAKGGASFFWFQLLCQCEQMQRLDAGLTRTCDRGLLRAATESPFDRVYLRP